MKTKILPWKLPPVIGYQMHAFPLSIIFDEEAYLPWFYSNYIQVYCNRNFSGVFFDFFNLNTGQWFDFCYPAIPCLISHSINSRILFDTKTDIHQFIKSCIDREFYISIAVDHFYIPQRFTYKKIHMNHDLMIYGYNLTDKHYHIMGFRDDEMFGDSQVSFKEFEKGYLKSQNPYTIIYMFKKNQDVKYEFDIRYVKEMFIDYLDSKDSTAGLGMLRNPDLNNTFGLKVYETLKTYLIQLLDKKAPIDVRAFHILWEHKKCMTLRIKFMQDQNYIKIEEDLSNKFTEVEQLSFICRNLSQRYEIKKDESIIKRMLTLLEQISAKETEALSEIMKAF